MHSDTHRVSGVSDSAAGRGDVPTPCAPNPPSGPSDGSGGSSASTVSDQDVFDFVDCSVEILTNKRDGTTEYTSGNGEIIRHHTPGAGLSAQEAEELAFIQKNGHDATALRAYYGMTAEPPKGNENDRTATTLRENGLALGEKPIGEPAAHAQSAAMKRFAVVAVLILIALWGGYSWVQSNNEQKQQAAAREDGKKRIAAAVYAMAKADHADTTWQAKLSDDQGNRISPVMTIELQREWLAPHPILFVGTVDDISQVNKQYRIRLSHGFNTRYRFLGSSLQLDLACPTNEIEPIIEAAKSSHSDFLDLGVAVTANISRIVTTTNQLAGGESEPLHIGYGDCVSLYFIGRETLR